ncbi:MAG TPA: hypothetical protein VGR61_03660 [Candidatus Dormibacteraeota bacterium]|nr:hypothetical protein [Candidatus Dormibacteraeota bacterium]
MTFTQLQPVVAIAAAVAGRAGRDASTLVDHLPPRPAAADDS